MTKYEPREHVIDAELANGNLDAWKQALGFPSTRKATMTDEPFGRQPKPVSVFFEGELVDIEYWINYLKRCAEFKGDSAERTSRGFKIYPRAVND